MVTSRAGRRLLARRSRSLPPPGREAAGSRGRARGAAGRGHGSPGGGGVDGGGGGGGGLLPARHCPERSRPQGCPAGREREVGGESAGKGRGGKRRGGSAADPAPTPPTPTLGSGREVGTRGARPRPGCPRLRSSWNRSRTTFRKLGIPLLGLIKAPELS